jgi:hypothetical protein
MSHESPHVTDFSPSYHRQMIAAYPSALKIEQDDAWFKAKSNIFLLIKTVL